MGDGGPDEILQDSPNQLAAAADVPQDLRREAYENVRTLTFWGVVAYAFFLPVPFFRFPLVAAFLLTGLQFVVIGYFLLVRVAVSRGRIPLRYAHEVLAATLAVPLVDLLLRAYLAYTPERGNLAALYLIGIGMLCLSRKWLAILLGTTIVSWLPLIWLHPERGGFAEHLLPLIAGGAVGLLARDIRLRAVHRVEQLRQRDARHLQAARENEARFREEAGVSAALARVGEELIAALDEPTLLERLCRVTTEVLECDLSHTYLRMDSDEVFTPVAVYGHTREHEEMLRALRLAPDVQPNLGYFIELLEREEAIATDLTTQSGALAQHGREHGISHLLHVALHRGGRLIGFHVAGYYGDHPPFTAVQTRIAKGLAHLASLALENVRLVSELGRASQLKSDFMATMSHELRTPLNVIIGFSDLLRGGTFGALNREQLDVLESIDRSTRELLELITATLDLSRLERGDVPLEIGAVDVGELLNEVHDENITLWQQAGRTLALHIPAALPTLRTDRTKLKVVLKNLIGNAAKFTPHGRIDVDVKARADGVDITVADTGVGIAADVLPVIFEPFRQGHAPGSHNHGGVGLGLYIVRRLLDMIDGAIEVESIVDKGSTFRVWVPLSIAGASAPPVVDTPVLARRRPMAARRQRTP